MVKEWQKQLEKFSQIEILKEIIQNILIDKLESYSVKKLTWYKDLYRIRKWKIRIVFKKNDEEIKIVNIDTRWWVYKWL